MRQNSDNAASLSMLRSLLLPLVFLTAAAEPIYAFDLEHIAKNTVSSHSFMSSNGRFVVLIGSNLVAPSGELNQAYLYDRDNDTFELISQNALGESADADVKLPKFVGQRAVTDDGRYVVFQTQATNLGASNPGNPGHVYVRDRDSETTTLVSKSSSGVPGDAPTVVGEFSIAPDGWGVIFNSTATNLDPGDTDGNANTYLHSIGGDTNLACFDEDAPTGKINGCTSISLSCTGAMAFVSGAANVDADDSHAGNDVFYGIPLSNSNTTISVPSGAAANTPSFSAPSISCDGNRIAFATKQSLTLADTDIDWDLYVHDLDTGVSALIRTPAGDSFRASEVTISPDGTWIAFRTLASLDPIDTSGAFVSNVYSVFYSRNRLVLGAPQLASQQGGAVGLSLSMFPSVGNNGGVAFQSGSSNFPLFNTDPKVLVNGCTPSVLTLNSDSAITQSFEACEIFADSMMVLTGNLTLRAQTIILGSGFSVEPGALLTLENF